MESRKKAVIIILIVSGISIFGYSQYVYASQIEASISQSNLLNEDEKGSNYDVELEFKNPSLLILTAGETEFFLISDDEIIGKGNLEAFTLQPLSSTYVNGTFHTDANSGDVQSLRISGITKYDLLVTSIDVPFVYYPTKEQTREFIHQN